MIKVTTTELAYIEKVAKANGIEPAALLAIIDVESNGVLYTTVEGQKLPVIRWEGHYFDRLVAADKRAAARKAGLASPKVGGIPNPASQTKRYDILDRARDIDEEAAFQSISIGIGQVMGSHFKDCGFPTAEAMFQHAATGLSGQIDLMMEYIKDNNLVDELQRKDWSAFARGYNGPQYRKNGYHTAMEKAYKQYAPTGGIVTETLPSENMIRMGSKGLRVKEIQVLLGRAGFPVRDDADFGPKTKQSVEAFQKANKLKVDGVVGPRTMEVLQTYKTAPDEKLAEVKPTDVKGVQQGGFIAIIGAIGLLLKNSFLGNFSYSFIAIALMLVIVVGAAFALDAYNKAKRTYEGTTA